MARQQQDVLLSDQEQPARKDSVPQPPPEPKDMPRYSATRSVRAAKLRQVDRNPDGTVTLIPEDSAFSNVQLGGTQAANIKGWTPSDSNSDPGYMVLEDTGQRYWMSTQEFEALYKSTK